MEKRWPLERLSHTVIRFNQAFPWEVEILPGEIETKNLAKFLKFLKFLKGQLISF